MALYEGGDRTRTGPYWRRQMHTTLPGERTGAELASINALRLQMGLPPLGGPTQHAAIAAPAGPQPNPPPHPFGANLSALVAALLASGGRAGRQIGVAGPLRDQSGAIGGAYSHLAASLSPAMPFQPPPFASPAPKRPRVARPVQPLHHAIISPLRRAYSY